MFYIYSKFLYNKKKSIYSIKTFNIKFFYLILLKSKIDDI